MSGVGRARCWPRRAQQVAGGSVGARHGYPAAAALAAVPQWPPPGAEDTSEPRQAAAQRAVQTGVRRPPEPPSSRPAATLLWLSFLSISFLWLSFLLLSFLLLSFLSLSCLSLS